ncbi:MAG: SDR family oxidoreductase [Alphaproteobacteria bacterium]
MIKLGITGYDGVLGSILCKKLKEENIEFSGFCGDLRNKSDIKNWINENNFEAIIHLAAIVPINDVNSNPLTAFDVNVAGTINLLEEFVKIDKDKWIFYASTSHVYKSSSEPITEDYTTNPISLYGKTKQMAEDVVLEASKVKDYNLSTCVGRIFSFYHETQKTPFLYPNLKKRLAEEDLSYPFELYGAESIRDFMNAEDIVDNIIKFMKKKSEGVFNLASGKGLKIKDFAQSLTDVKLNIIHKGSVDILVANITKMKNELGEN